MMSPQNPMNKPRSNYTPTRARDSAVRPGQWTTGPWSQCPVTCGGAVQTRTVVCLSRQRDETAARCDAAKRPADANVCNAQACPRWHPGRWSKCTQQCGGGTRARIVYCARPDGARTYNHECDVTRRPSDVERCGDRPCSADHRWRKTEWSQCSSTCGRGVKTRNVTCVDQRSGLGVSDDACATARRPKPKQVRRCMVQRRCPRWRTGSWNQCSATCGEGKQVRRVSCRYKRKVIIDQLCDSARRPDDVQRCRTHHCPTYHWSPGEWGTCSTSCGEGVMTRRLTCRRKPDDAVADHPSRCNSTDDDVTMPMTSQRCSNGPCTAQWKVGSWTECSATCGPGRQRRAIRCTFVDLVTFDEREVTSCDGSRAPSRDRDCDRGDCDSQVLWRVGSWTECSTSCGDGIQQRRVVCVDRQTLDPLGDAVCNAIPSFRPDAIRRCHRAPCLPTTCRYLKIHYGVSRDDEYQLTLRGKSAKVYCRGMSTSRPLEYVTLPGGEQENYSEIYGYRLISADTCPYNGTRADTCACHRDHPDAGLTRYRKVRLDVAAMRVVGTDMTFATTVHGRPVPFGVAGDCYSRVQCPQGKFRMDFSRTSFVVSSTARWRSYGSESSMRIRQNPDGAAVDGHCGGYCSRCQPDPLTGLILDHKT